MKKIILLLLAVIFFTSCQKENEIGPIEIGSGSYQGEIVLTAQEAERLPLFEATYTLSHDQIIATAYSFIESENGQPTKSTAHRTAVLSDSVIFDLPVATRSMVSEFLPQQAKIYIVNFENNAGWVIISGDKRISSNILAYSDSGNLELETDHPGIEIAVEGMKGYVYDEIVRMEAMRGDETYLSMQKRYGFGNDDSQNEVTTRASYYPNPDDYEIVEGLPGSSPDKPWGTQQAGNWQVVTNGIAWYWAPVDRIVDAEHISHYDRLTRVYPLLRSQWDQLWPYNTRVNAVHGGTYPVGCVATALAQIMNYHKKPSGYLWDQFAYNNSKYLQGVGQEQFTWETRSDAVYGSIGQLMYDIGISLQFVYTSGSTFPRYNDKEATILPAYGYSSSGLQSYNAQILVGSLNGKCPVYMTGFTATIGHAWVVDGHSQVCNYNIQYRNCYYQNEYVGHIKVNTINYTTSEEYLHINWGWSGRADGWYLAGNFKNSYYQFDRGFSMIPYIR